MSNVLQPFSLALDQKRGGTDGSSCEQLQGAAAGLNKGDVGKTPVANKPAEASMRALLRGSANPLSMLENIWVEGLGEGLRLMERLQRSLSEFGFIAPFDESLARKAEALPEFKIIASCNRTGRAVPYGSDAELHFAETLIPMLLVVCRERSDGQSLFTSISRSFETTEPFRKIGPELLAELVDRQTFILDREPDRALASIGDRLTSPTDRRRGLEIVQKLAGNALKDGSAAITRVWQQLSALGRAEPRSAVDVIEKPAAAARRPDVAK